MTPGWSDTFEHLCVRCGTVNTSRPEAHLVKLSISVTLLSRPSLPAAHHSAVDNWGKIKLKPTPTQHSHRTYTVLYTDTHTEQDVLTSANHK